ncbi:secretion protein HlyD family protein [Thiomicrospira aerophila AL3]|uniref:Secretion protein HlyD family protein n=1 Tax=Thiomicrospira aerophila AL3 TaxID=717772 RepID=W0DS52_9GAMM|nr:efflux RND transporter periplasmic adaptor subunit [Thiomicrospira aerophila]AHF01465.1 secretion protein HlyD family protein [Thiomicrospira aerophila AL3]
MTKFADVCQRVVAIAFLFGASAFALAVHAQTLVVGSLVSGQVMQILHPEGSQVKQGDLILVIDDREYQARLRMLEAERDRAAALFTDAEIEMANIEDLFDRTVIAKRPYQQAQRDFAVAKANLAIAEAKLAAHQAWLSYYHVRAPQQGRIKQLTVSAGSTVFKENQPLFELEIGVE